MNNKNKAAIVVTAVLVAMAAHAATTNLTGVVTFQRDDLSFFFIDDAAGSHWRVQGAKGASTVKIGDIVHVDGEREMTTKRRVADATITIEGHAMAAIPPPLETGIADLFSRLMPFGNTDLYGGMIVTEGLLRDINRRQTTTQLLVGEGDSNLQVEIPWALEEALPANLVQGATVRVKGVLTWTSIENYEEGIFGRIENVELIPPTPDAVEVIRRAPFWTVGRLLFILMWVCVLSAALAVWTDSPTR